VHGVAENLRQTAVDRADIRRRVVCEIAPSHVFTVDGRMSASAISPNVVSMTLICVLALSTLRSRLTAYAVSHALAH